MNAANLGRLYADGEAVVREGEIGDCMFALQTGRLEVLRTGKGGEVRLGTLKAGDVFGEMAIFESEVRSATVRALGEARVLTIDRRTFLRRVHEDPSLAFNLVRIMCGHVRRLSAVIAELKPGGDVTREPLSPITAERRVERRRTGERRRGIERRKSPGRT